MIKLSQLLKAVNMQLKESFKNVPVDSLDLEEKFHRPSFRTSLDGLKTSAFGTTFKERAFTIRIYYFPADKHKGRLERIKVIEGLEDAFLQSLNVTKDFIIPVDSIHFDETDGVLVASFDSITMERIYNDIDTPMMEELKYNATINEK